MLFTAPIFLFILLFLIVSIWALAEVADACDNNYVIFVVFMLIAQVSFIGTRSMVHGACGLRLITKERMEMRND